MNRGYHSRIVCFARGKGASSSNHRSHQVQGEAKIETQGSAMVCHGLRLRALSRIHVLTVVG